MNALRAQASVQNLMGFHWWPPFSMKSGHLFLLFSLYILSSLYTCKNFSLYHGSSIFLRATGEKSSQKHWMILGVHKHSFLQKMLLLARRNVFSVHPRALLFWTVISSCLPVYLSDILTWNSTDVLRTIFIIIYYRWNSSYLNSSERLVKMTCTL